MLRILFLLLLVDSLTVAGCGKGQPPATTKTETTASPAPDAPRRAPPAASAPVRPKAAATAPDPSPARDLAARYLESDGHGGWRKNEQAATELEKLAANASGQIWPLLSDKEVEVRRGAAVFLLPLFDPGNPDHVAAFTALLDDRDSMIRARAIDAARQFTPKEQIAVLPKMQTMLDPRRE